MEILPTIGLEIHAQLRTASKAFCGCSTLFGAPPNTLTCPVCLGLPGALPVLNSRAVEFAARAALALGCTVHARSVFARKHYFYPDLPKGYQISQFDEPLASSGSLALSAGGAERRIRIRRLHIEEDAGKSLHDAFDDATGIDFNRSGVPLIEIVTEPDLESPASAAVCFSTIREMLVGLGITDGNMEEGSLRCDANVSVGFAGADRLGVKVEVKNINSFRHLQQALEYEVGRQTALLARGQRVQPETRLWDTGTGTTSSMRTKEGADDYRYFPEPDLPPLVLAEETIDGWRRTQPELPAARRARFTVEYQLPEYDAGVLTQARPLADYFEAVARACGNPKAASNWVMVEVLGRLNAEGLSVAHLPIPPEHLARLIELAESGRITGPTAKQVFERMFAGGGDPVAIVDREGLASVQDAGAIATLVRGVLEMNPKPVQQYRAGKTQTFGFLVGQVMKASRGTANPEKVAEALRRALESTE